MDLVISALMAYKEGGYETSETASNVHPETERTLKPAIFKLLED